MNGEDIFSFVHPDDQNTLKDVFNNAMLELGRPCKSKYIRLRVRNGCYVYVNSWWSFFINPWSRQLEFVHGKHTVKKGPRYADVFAEIVKDVTAEPPEVVVDLKHQAGGYVLYEVHLVFLCVNEKERFILEFFLMQIFRKY